ncbi:methyl-accepting chemotaxis protein [Paenibacillus aestuarii]|uniref:HAMP domain-containing methyl-accepting chemotaxis protein n=1 Tax=Paenibacillus aestuarii TaxID=516965 RepID=A0ABW0K4H5_9BACL|nr:HAMP domain-containing methyl-accepting chemotaxis protein [Paenibacillus aestuarii]
MLTVARKLFLLVCISAVAMAVLTGIGYSSMNGLSKSMKVMYEDRLVPAINYGKYRANNRAMETTVFQIMQRTMDQEGNELEAKFKTLANTNNQFLKDLQSKDLPPQEKEVLAKIIAAYPDYLNALQTMIDLGVINKNDEAYTYYTTKAAEPMNTVITLGNQLESIIQADAESMSNSNAADARKAILFSIVISVVMIIICSGLGILITRMIVKPIRMIQAKMAEAEKGDFTGHIPYQAKDELGQLTSSFNRMMEQLRGLFGDIKQTAHLVASYSAELTASAEQTSVASESIANTVQEVASGASQQVNSVKEATATLRHMGAGVQQIAANAQIVSDTSTEASEKSVKGNEAIMMVGQQMNSIQGAIHDLGQVIDGLGQRSEQIGEIVDTITSIAAQTNLLALNAAIEAARAGESGRGFAVVAAEVRKLAEESSVSASKIANIINSIQTDTNQAVQSMKLATNEVLNGIERAGTAGVSFEQIQQAVNNVAGQIEEVSSAIQQMAAGTEQMIRTIEVIHEAAQTSAAGTQNITAATEEQLASMEEISSSSASLSHMAEELQTKISRFKI